MQGCPPLAWHSSLRQVEMAYISIRSIASLPSFPVFNPFYTFHPQEFWGHSQTERGYNKSLVLRVYRNRCYLVEGNDVVQQSLEMCNLQVFSVWDQEVQTVMLKNHQVIKSWLTDCLFAWLCKEKIHDPEMVTFFGTFFWQTGYY